MKKSVLIKGILILLVIALLTIGSTGCAPSYTYPTTGTVYLSIANDDYWYDIYIDTVWKGETNVLGNLTIYNVPIGSHLFEAYDFEYYWYGSKWQYINPGTNYVTIYAYPY